MEVIDITKNFLELFVAKKNIETFLIDEGEIDKEFTLPEFIQFIKFGTHIYCKSETDVYPFKIIKIGNMSYLFTANVNSQDYTPLFEALESIEYDFNNLTMKEPVEVATEKLIGKPFFVINHKIHLDLRDKE